MKYRVPENVHAVSAHHQTFEADENGEIDLSGASHAVIHDLVTLQGVTPVQSNHPAIPAPPAAALQDAELPGPAGAADDPANEAAAAASTDAIEAAIAKGELDETPMRLAAGSVTPPRRKKAEKAE